MGDPDPRSTLARRNALLDRLADIQARLASVEDALRAERDHAQATRDGMAAARARGVHVGRPRQAGAAS